MKLTSTLKGSSALRGIALFAALTGPAAALAESVTLKSQDGTINITGDFIAFEDNFYLIGTALGELRLSAERVSCDGAACPSFDVAPTDAEVIFAGSDTVGTGVLPLVLEGYAGFLDAESVVQATGNTVVASFIGEGGFGDDLGSYQVKSSSSSAAFSALLDGNAEIGMSSRRIRSDEARKLSNAGAGNMNGPDQEHIIAIDSIVVITHPDNPVERISMDDLAKIYTGQIRNWRALGGPDLAIQVIDRPQDGGTYAAFAERVLGPNGRVTGQATVAQDNTDMASLVNANVGAIGYTGYAFRRGAKALTLINECGQSMRPDPFSARTEEYALQRRLYLYTRGDALSPSAEQFLDYALSENADGLIAKAGFIDLGVDRRSQTLDTERETQIKALGLQGVGARVSQDMLDALPNYDRLSTTFRFRTGSSELDERAVVDMKRLMEYLEDMPGAEIKIVGFTDSVGTFENNLRLAEGRANQVRAALEDFAGDRLNGITVTTAAYSELAPSACNATDTGRAINRRVEVWIKTAG